MPLETLSREELIAIIVAQQKTIQELTAKIAELEERLNKDNHNSSKPPSSDGYKKLSPKSLRQKSGRKAGGQKGYNGHNIPDRIENIYPAVHVVCSALRIYYALSEKRGRIGIGG